MASWIGIQGSKRFGWKMSQEPAGCSIGLQPCLCLDGSGALTPRQLVLKAEAAYQLAGK